MSKLFSKSYTIRFIVAFSTTDYLTKTITAFCNERNLNLKELKITDSIKKDSNSSFTIMESSFVSIIGSKKDFEILYNFLSELGNADEILMLTL